MKAGSLERQSHVADIHYGLRPLNYRGCTAAPDASSNVQRMVCPRSLQKGVTLAAPSLRDLSQVRRCCTALHLSHKPGNDHSPPSQLYATCKHNDSQSWRMEKTVQACCKPGRLDRDHDTTAVLFFSGRDSAFCDHRFPACVANGWQAIGEIASPYFEESPIALGFAT
jgi:hypothetical protein